MSHLPFQLLSLIFFFLLFPYHARQIPYRILAQNNSSQSSSCPLNFADAKSLLKSTDISPSNDINTNCPKILGVLRIVLSEYLKSTGSFYPPLNSSDSCWNKYDSVVDSFIPGFKIRSSCGFQSSWISKGCMNISTQSQFEKLVQPDLNDVVSSCNQSLYDNSGNCASCLTSISTMRLAYLTANSDENGNISDCTNMPFIYVSGVINHFGPTDPGTAKCLLSVDLFSDENGNNLKKRLLISLISVVGFIGLCLIIGGYLYYVRLKKKKERKAKRKRMMGRTGSETGPNLQSINGSTHLIKYSLDEIKQATNKFHRDNLIGKGGYGNVYKGVLPNGCEIAIKRFKNCSAAGDASFTHEVEVIASIRHVNLVELRGYCVATTNLEGHQRLIVCDLMHNGSLHDHLFGDFASEKKLSWPIRQKIALGMARGLAYLHYGAQPSVIHRDIKASNILLDDDFEAKVADFGLAKFNPEGFTHLSTRVAGTMGYVAPEYALYGQLTERSDVFSFGVVLLELLSGKKAILSGNDGQGQPLLVTDWAWSLVRKGHVLDVIEEGMPELGPDQVMEKYVLTAVLCSHPQLYARPTMDQVVKILETDLPVPSIPERPISFIAELEDIERSISSNGSGQLSTSGGYQTYSMGSVEFPTHSREDKEDDPATPLS
ncbi:unnamed protein product [Amaranthus hypochondriacus]